MHGLEKGPIGPGKEENKVKGIKRMLPFHHKNFQWGVLLTAEKGRVRSMKGPPILYSVCQRKTFIASFGVYMYGAKTSVEAFFCQAMGLSHALLRPRLCGPRGRQWWSSFMV